MIASIAESDVLCKLKLNKFGNFQTVRSNLVDVLHPGLGICSWNYLLIRYLNFFFAESKTLISLPFHWICTLITHESIRAENFENGLRKTFTKLWQLMLYTRGWSSIFLRQKITGSKNNNLTWYSAKSMNSFVFNLWFVHHYLAFYTSNNKFDC